MTAFGGYETVRELAGSGLAAVYIARAAGGGDATFAVKAFHPVPLAGESDAAQGERQVAAFLEAAKIQRAAAESGGGNWAPIRQSGQTDEGAFYVTDCARRSLQQLIQMKLKIDGRTLHAIVTAVAAGLRQLEQSALRPHGNLKPSNVLITTDGAVTPASVVLTDPAPTAYLDKADPVVDLRAVGELIYQLVLHRPFRKGGWPVGASKEWSRLGPRAEGWRKLCNQLLDAELTPAAMTLEALTEAVGRLQAKRGVLTARRLIVAGALVAVIAAGGVVYYLRTKPSIQEVSADWKKLSAAYADWFGILQSDLRDPDRQGRWESDPELAGIVRELREKDFGIDPRRIIGDQSVRPRDLAEMSQEAVIARYGDKLGSWSGGRQAKEYWRVVEGIRRRLNAWRQRALLESVAKEYEGRSWPGPAQECRLLAGSCGADQKTRISAAVDSVLKVTPTLTAIEGRWKNVQQWRQTIEKAGAEQKDPVLQAFPEFLRGALHTASAPRGPKDIESLQQGLEELEYLARDLGKVVGGTWAAEVDKATFVRLGSVHQQFRSTRAVDREAYRKWVSEAQDPRFKLIPHRNPFNGTAWDQQIAAAEGLVGELTKLEAHYAKPQADGLRRRVAAAKAQVLEGRKLPCCQAAIPELLTMTEAVQGALGSVRRELEERTAALGSAPAQADPRAEVAKVRSSILAKLKRVIRDEEKVQFEGELAKLGAELPALLELSWNQGNEAYIVERTRGFGELRGKLTALEKAVDEVIPKGDPRLESRALLAQARADAQRMRDALKDNLGYEKYTAKVQELEGRQVGGKDFWALSWDVRGNQRVIADEALVVRPLVEELSKAVTARLAVVKELAGRDRVSPTGSAVLDAGWRGQRDKLIATVLEAAELSRQAAVQEAAIRKLDEDFPKTPTIAAAPRDFDPAGAGRMFLARREAALGKALWGQAAGVLAAELGEWSRQVTAMAADFKEIEGALDQGYGLDEPTAGGKTVRGWLAAWPEGGVRGAFGGPAALGPVLERVKGLAEAATMAKAQLVEEANRMDDPSHAVGSWRRLGGAGWPASVAELKEELRIREKLTALVGQRIAAGPRQEALKKELTQQAAARWKACFEGLSMPAEVDGAIGMMGQFGLSMESPGALSAGGMYNLALHEFINGPGGLKKFNADVEKVGEVPEQLKMLGQFRPRIDGFLAKARGILGASAGREPAARFLAGLEEMRNWAPKEGDTTKAGPGAVPGWTAVTVSPKQMRFTWQVGRASHTVEFIQIQPAGAAKPVFLSTTEVPVDLFRDALRELGKGGEITSAHLPSGSEWTGPRTWNAFRETIGRNSTWLMDKTSIQENPKGGEEPYYPENGKPKGPTDRSPVQYVPPKAAIEVARLLGCRLPTAGEWTAAYQAYGKVASAGQRNLRDGAWKRQYDYIAGLKNLAPPADWPDEGIFWPAGVARKTGKDAAAAVGTDDGVLWFADVGGGEGAFHHLAGNVAEWVYSAPAELEAVPMDKPADKTDEVLKGAAGKLAVIGGSALSPAEEKVDQAYPADVAEAASGYSDVGFRLAFTAPVESLYQRTQGMLDGLRYLSGR